MTCTDMSALLGRILTVLTNLVNGKMEIIHNIKGDFLHIMFKVKGKDIICPIKKIKFTTYDPVSESLISKLVQFPLKQFINRRECP